MCTFNALFLQLFTAKLARTRRFFWLQQAANRNHPDACYEYGIMTLDMSENTRLALKYIRLAADLFHIEAIRAIAYFYFHGYVNGIPDFVEAIRWYNEGMVMNDMHSTYALALIHENGTGVDKDNQQALFYYEKAAKLGHKKSQQYMSVHSKGLDQENWSQLATRNSTMQNARWTLNCLCVTRCIE